MSGTLSADRSQSLVNYADFRNISQRNVRTVETESASADAILFGGWHAVGGVEARSSRTTTPIADVGSFRSDGANAGVKYFVTSTTSIGGLWRRLDGHYVDQPIDPVTLVGDRFTRDEAELAGVWSATGRSTVDARLAHVSYREHPFAERNFSGEEAKLGWRWQPSGRISTTVDLGRALTPWRDATATYRAENRISAGLAWQLSARVTASGNAAFASSRFYNPIVAPAEPRRDTFRSAGVSLDWRPLRYATFTASLPHQNRGSTLPNFAYEETLATLGASLNY